MIHKEINYLLSKVDCRYTLVVETAKRARQLIDGATPLTEDIETNFVSQAVDEIEQDKITYLRSSDGIK
jgi:DNA-directed RNA polymerase subunit omega